ncbi:MAG TPA: alanine--tRNA ligase, partial [Stellaceae bacterium]|nr:alanine--tRNA ligase [Stellaceae bacterium]
SIDTGMGLERIAAVMQGKHDNYDIDILRALIVASAEASHVAADGPQAVSHRVIADHLRASAFLIADGVLPAKEGRGYVLRRIMRRAMRHAHMLGTAEPLMWRLVPALVRQMGAPYPELVRAEALITETLKLEETGFRETLARGLKLLDEEEAKLAKGKAFPGEIAFKLYDTYGFPLDLTEDVLRGRGRKVETTGFETAMARQRAEARKSWVGSGEAATGEVWLGLREKLGVTEFLGYEAAESSGAIEAIVIDGESVNEAKAGAEAAIVVSQTPFYAESGGQMGDTGAMVGAKGEFQVSDTQKRAGELYAHLGKVTRGSLKVGEAVDLRIDTERRDNLRANHSVTHLLHQALRRRLGEHVTQKGSLVAPDRLRFDFSHPRALTPEDVAAVEHAVNARIRQNAEVSTRLMTPERAVEQGALALFGEKYGDEVRVVSMGDEGDHQTGQRHFSVELCGGTHVRRTGDIGFFKIASESAVASGVRRIEALTGAAAEKFVAEEENWLHQAALALKTGPGELPARLAALLDERKKLERELSDVRRSAALAGNMGGGAGAKSDTGAKDLSGVKFASRALDNVPAKELKSLADEMKRQIGSGVVALVAREEGKASIVVGVTDDLMKRFDAVELVKLGAAALGGKGGGGRPDMAQAGGPDVGQVEAALAAVERAVAEKAKAA